jgi:hypothetical protein
MHKLILLLLLTLSSSAFAQSVLTIDTQKCLWHPGDDPAWAALTLDESAWRPYSEWTPTPGHPHLWVRCHVDLNSLRSLEHPAIQVSMVSAYQLYLNGASIGIVGNLRNGNFNLNAIRSFPLTPNPIPRSSLTIALRITDRSFESIQLTIVGSKAIPLRLRIGEASVFDALGVHEKVFRAIPYLFSAVCYGVIGVAALMLLGIYLFDSGRIELLLLSLYCLSNAVFFLDVLAASALLNYPVSAYLWIFYCGQIAIPTFMPLFFFAITRQRVPIAMWIFIAINALAHVPRLIDASIAANQPQWLDPLMIAFVSPVINLSQFATSFAPFLAFLPLSRLPPRMRQFAVPCMLWGVCDLSRYALQMTRIPWLGLPDFSSRWRLTIIDARSFTVVAVIVVLFVLLLREQREATLERALLAGELQAASEIQRMLAPAVLDCAPGLHIDVAFHPMRDVGGDFYLCRVLPNGVQRVVLGDVSGKGSAAAMTAALLLGGAADHDTEAPADLLAHLNRVLFDSRVGGFATCLCADISPDGQVILANAGHLAPYIHREEAQVAAGLPLGLTRQQNEYMETRLSLPPGDTLTLISDGVVEARSQSGELFGFDRTRAISNRSADQIAREAQAHGQEDDITVLTLTFLPVGVVHA